MPSPALPTITFASAEAWSQWLAREHTTSSGVWIQFARRGSGIPSVTYAEAVESALCYGWIDGQVKRLDPEYYMQKFVPRRKGSIWSKINRGKALALIEGGQMQAAGYAAIEEAKRTGRWDTAYDSPSKATVPPDFATALADAPKASECFATLTGSRRYAILFRLQTTKRPSARAALVEKIVRLLSRGETFR